jgi:Protein of unknown function (DUF2569)
MDMVSVWKWLAVLVVLGGPVLLLVRDLWRRRAGAAAEPPLTGIRGWLAMFAFMLCFGFARGVAELALAVPDYLSGFQNEDARGPLAILGMTALAVTAVHLWAIVALFRKRRALRIAYAIMGILMILGPLSLLPMLTVPGVRLDMFLSDGDIARSIAALIVTGAWYWYLCASVRVKNTLVN